MSRFICIHGHFYQPPRENPWLEQIEPQESAYPFENWNERITSECYEPNLTSRILDAEARIQKIVDNYSRISFDFGPTLLRWLERNTPEVHEGIIEADRKSRSRFGGHGNAIAAPFGHMIMPLASRRDKVTQILWGIRDFEKRFGRQPEGMWLPETAVDSETLGIMAQEGIQFTILAPSQARRIRSAPDGVWREVEGGRVEIGNPYRVHLSGDREIAVFFYEGPISNSVAFDHLLNEGGTFAQRLMSAFPPDDATPYLLHIATDGETYGHHHRYGDMALAYALNQIESGSAAKLTNYAEYLAAYPPTAEAEILENTSWSCAHGIERWNSDCGCNSGGHPEWNQAWRAPLREALDELREAMDPAYEKHLRKYLADPWAARDDYVSFLNQRTPEAAAAFMKAHATRPLEHSEAVAVWKLLEMQRFAMYMYTSCGWFFDDISGIETVQILRYAARAIQIARDVLGEDFEADFVKRLRSAKSNVMASGNGKLIYESEATTAQIDLLDAAAHFAVWALFEPSIDVRKIYCYSLSLGRFERSERGQSRMVLGWGRIRSEVTQEEISVGFGAFHRGGIELEAKVLPMDEGDVSADLFAGTAQAFQRGDFDALSELFTEHFGARTFSIGSLFKYERRKVLEEILEPSLKEAEEHYRQIHESNTPLIVYLAALKVSPPRAFQLAAQYVLNSELRQAFSCERLDLERIEKLLEAARKENIDLDDEGLSQTLSCAILCVMDQWEESPTDLGVLGKLTESAALAAALPFRIDVFKVQNAYYKIMNSLLPDFRARAERAEVEAVQWTQEFVKLGRSLSFRIE